jgi:proline iminopeptidase
MKTQILYPPISPYNEGYLKVSPIHTLHFEQVGNPNGKPVIFLHGGPGVGIVPAYRRFFDPKFYRIILLDQRGSGKSTPFADLRENTTQDLVNDLEKLKKHLQIKQKWIVTGGSWGSTLAIAYSKKYPKSVKAILIRGVFLGREKENLWLTEEGGASEIWPDEWEKFISIIPKKHQKNLPLAYYKLLTSKNKTSRIKAAIHWSKWEGTIMNLIPQNKNKKIKILNPLFNIERAISFAKIESYYSMHNFFIKDKKLGLLKNIKKIKNIPLTIIQGRYDTICPIRSAYDLHKALPKSKLIIVPTGSHNPTEPPMASELIMASNSLKQLY